MNKKQKAIILVSVGILTLALGTYLNRGVEYVAEVKVELSDEDKLTNFLSEKMVEQKEARVLEQRAFEALEEAVALRILADEEVDSAIENIKLYQGIE